MEPIIAYFQSHGFHFSFASRALNPNKIYNFVLWMIFYLVLIQKHKIKLKNYTDESCLNVNAIINDPIAYYITHGSSIYGPWCNPHNGHGYLYCTVYGYAKYETVQLGRAGYVTWARCAPRSHARTRSQHSGIITSKWLNKRLSHHMTSHMWPAGDFFSANEDCHPPIFQPIIWRVF